MPARIESAPACACEDNWQFVVIMPVAIANRASVNEHRILQHGLPIRVLHGIEIPNKSRESFHVPTFDLGDFENLLLVTRMIRQEMMPFHDSKVRKRPIASF